MSSMLTGTSECVTVPLRETPHEFEDTRPFYGGRLKTILLMLVILVCICGAVYF
jgi:hypothetical protein